MDTPVAPRHLPWFDALRAAAALLVLVSHIRDFTLRDAADQPALSLTGRFFFAFTGLGHQAVIVFFVLSGYLVTRSMQRLAAQGQWSLLRLGVDRLSRLWLVLIPCLLFGGLLDRIGLSLAGQGIGPESYGALAITTPLAPPAWDTATLLGNFLFLQTLVVPVYGSNGPLWSLADEAWFYGLAALAFSAMQPRRRRTDALLPLAAALAVIVWLPGSILALFPVWLCGAACALVTPEAKTSSLKSIPAAALACFALLLLGSRLRLGPGPLVIDWAVGAATAWLLACAARLPWPDRWWSRSLLGISALSYSLYLSHVPVLALLTAVLVGPHRGALDGAHAAIMILDAGVALASAAALWWGFERHTPALRRLLLRCIATRPATNTIAIRGTAT